MQLNAQCVYFQAMTKVIEHNISVAVIASCPQWLTGDNNQRRLVLAETKDGKQEKKS